MREQALRERIEELEEECRQLREMLVPPVTFPRELGLSKTENDILSFILARAPNVALKSRILHAVWPDPDNAPDGKCVDVHICKLRRKLSPFGVAITVAWSEGYFLDAIAATTVRSWLDGAPPARIAAPAPAAAVQPVKPAANPDRAGWGLIAAQVRLIRAFAAAGHGDTFIARQCDLPVSTVRMITRGR